MRLIDADALIEFCAERWIPLNIDAVNMQPTIQPEKAQLSQQGTTSDLISRQAVIDALAEQMPTPYTPDGSHPADEQIFQVQEVYVDCITTIKLLPTIQPVATDTNVGNNSEIPNSSDAVSRQAVLDAIVQCTNCGDEDTLREYVLKHSLDNGWTGGILEALDAVKDLPSAQPERKKGEWSDGYRWQRCSLCKQTGKKSWNYCPNCGADMRGEKDERTD